MYNISDRAQVLRVVTISTALYEVYVFGQDGRAEKKRNVSLDDQIVITMGFHRSLTGLLCSPSSLLRRPRESSLLLSTIDYGTKCTELAVAQPVAVTTCCKDFCRFSIDSSPERPMR